MLLADIHTLFLAAIATGLVLAIMVGAVVRSAAQAPLRYWALGLLFHTGAYVLFALRGKVADILSFLVANVAESIFVSLWAYAVARLLSRSLHGAWLGVPPLVMALVFVLFMPDPVIRVPAGNLVLLSQLGLILYLLWEIVMKRREAGAIFLFASVAVTCILILIRVVSMITGSEPFVSLTTQSTLQTLIYLTGSVVPVVGTIGFLLMINERAQRRIVEGENRFRTIYDSINDAIFIHEPESMRIVDVNTRACSMYGYRREALLGIDFAKLCANEPPFTPGDAMEWVELCKKEGWQTFEWRARDRQDRLFWVSVSLQTVVLNDEPCILAVIRDIDISKRIEEDLRAALRVIEASPVVSYRLEVARDGTETIGYISENIQRWGYQATDLLSGRLHHSTLIHPDDYARVHREMTDYVAAGMVDATQEYRMRLGSGEYHWVKDNMHIVRDAAGHVVAFEGLVSDIEMEKQATQKLQDALASQRELNEKLEQAHNQLLQSEKMASIGQLAAGVAHELNNPIGFVYSNLGTLKTYLDDILQIAAACESTAAQAAKPEDMARIEAIKREKDFDYLKTDIYQLMRESVDGLQRVKKIVQDLKDFSRPGEVAWQWADINQGIESTLNIVWNELKYKCTIEKHYGELPRVYCLIAQLNQVIMNLLVNAAQAIEKQGTITITTRAQGEEQVQILIADTGQGIAAENLPRLFDPFFTTKPVGKGTGLGLSISWSIIERHHGKIEVASEVGKGTTFTITLPVAPDPSENSTIPVQPPAAD